MTNSLTLTRVVDAALARLGLIGLRRRLALAEVRRAAYERARAELDTYSDRDLQQDLRIGRAQIHELAAEEAELAAAAFARARPEHRDARHEPASTAGVAFMAH